MIHRLALAALLAATAPLAAHAATPADPWQAKAREILAKSVSFKTSVSGGETPKLAAWLAEQFTAAGIPASQITTVPLGNTAAMVMRIPGRDKTKKPILLSSHLDVVEANPQDWQRDPFTLIEENGYFFGRGAADDKQGVAHLATMAIRIASQKLKPSRDLIFVFIGDEETQMATTALLAGPKKALIDAEYALNADSGGGQLDASGKPLTYSIQGGEKTYADFILTASNPGGHSSAPRPDNAIYQLAAALQKVAAYKFPVQSNALTVSTFRTEAAVTPGELGQAMAAFAANPVDGPAAQRLSAEPSLVGQLRTTCVATLLSGGHAENALPQSASANVNCRIWPGTGIESVRKTLEQVIGDSGITISSKVTGSIESPASEPRADVTRAVEKALAATWGAVPVSYSQESGASDGSHYRANGIPTYGVTLMFSKRGDSFAHGLNERIPVESFDKSTDGWWVLLKELADPR